MKELIKKIVRKLFGSNTNQSDEKLKDANVFFLPHEIRHFHRYEFAKKFIDGGKFLDAACGCGYGGEFLEPFEEYVGLDYADYCIQFANTHYGGPGKKYVEGNIYELGKMFPNNYFDRALSFETLEHIDHPDQALLNLLQVVKPKGKVIVSIPLNHPDLIYHKRIYQHKDVIELLHSIDSSRFSYQEFLQRRVDFIPITDPLADEQEGTWFCVITKN